MNGYREIVRNRPFLLLLAGQLTSQFGNFAGYMAVMALLYKLTGSSLLVGVYLAAQAVAGLVAGPLAGVVADRTDSRRLMAASDLIRAALVLLLLLADSPWKVIGIAAAKSAASAFFTPARGRLTPKLVPGEHLSAAFSLEQTLQSAVQVAGPALGGLLVLAAGVSGALLVDAVTFVASLVTILLLPSAVPSSAGGLGGDRPVENGWLSGYRQLLKHPVYARLTLMKGVSLLGVWAINVVLVAFAYQELQAGDAGVGLFTSALGAGAMIGGMVGGATGRTAGAFTVMGLAALAVGGFVAGAGLANTLSAACVLFLLAGVGIGMYNVNFAVTLQTSVDQRFLGRAFAGGQVIDNLIVLAGLAGGGLLADLVGVRPVLMGGAGFIALAGVLALVGVAQKSEYELTEVFALEREPDNSKHTDTPTKSKGQTAPAPKQPANQGAKRRSDGDDGQVRIVRVAVKVSDHGAKGEAAARAEDGGENSISIGYDGTGTK